jgi:branched-chain amino acid transport system substrate-binding protein
MADTPEKSTEACGEGAEGSLVQRPLTRRQFIRVAGATGAALGLGGALAGCGGDDETTTTAAAGETTTSAAATESTAAGGEAGREIKLGFVTPLTGPLAGFGEADTFCVEQWQAASADGLVVNGVTHPVTFIVKDSQSNSGRAAEVAGDLINNDKIDLMLVASTPDTVNPVAGQCEAAGVPCISNDTPWQAYYFDANGEPAVDKWSYHFFWGLEDVIENFTTMWATQDTNQVVAAMFPNDPDGNAWADPEKGLPPALAAKGYTLVDPGRYQNGTEDFSPQIAQFKEAGAQIVTGVMIPPDFTTFWKQCAQQGFKPICATIGKALLFPSSIEALGDIGAGLTTEVWWTPTYPFTSSLTGENCQELADSYTATTGKQWTQPLLHYALYEVAADVLQRTTDIDSPDAIVEAIKATKMDTIAGPVDWSSGPVPNVSKTPQVGGQWVKGTDWPFDLQIVVNPVASMVPTTAEVQPLAT